MKINKPLYDTIDIIITLKCNLKCLNCIKFCHMDDITGLDYSNYDMTIGHINNFIHQVKELNYKPVFNTICITGGEALLHPLIEQIMSKLKINLLDNGYTRNIVLNSNSIIEPPKSISKFVYIISTPEQKKNIHHTALFHPNDFGGKIYTYNSCKHNRKNTIVLTVNGYSACCAADAYIRLFGYEDLIIDTLPKSISEFPIDKMDKICKECPFGNTDNNLPLEKNLGRPVSNIYLKEAELNKNGRKINKRFGEKEDMLKSFIGKYATDKFTEHTYSEPYQYLLDPRKDTAKNVLEIGVQNGGSMLLFHDFFSNAHIYGMDVIPLPKEFILKERMAHILSNAYDLKLIKDKFSNQLFDVIIDDGPHSLDSMLFTAKNYSTLLAPNGTLIIEDIPSIEWVTKIINEFPNQFKSKVRIFDNRYIRNRWDDILVAIDNRDL